MSVTLSTSIGSLTFPGFERDWEMETERNIRWVEVIGGPPMPVQIFPTADTDIVQFTVSVWLSGAGAAIMEGILPPYATGTAANIAFDGPSTVAPIPGFGYWAANVWTLSNVTFEPVESLGRKGPIMDLFGYRLKGEFQANGRGSYLNERGRVVLPSTSLPAVVGHKLKVHQIQDWSAVAHPMPKSGAYAPTVQHGRRFDGTVQLDHLTIADADAVESWFRTVRGSSFTLTGSLPFGPSKADSVAAVARSLTLRRGAGWWWEGELSVSLFA